MKGAAAFLVGLALVFGLSVYAGHRLIPPEHRDLSQFSLAEDGSGSLGSESQYKKIKLAFGAFDLMNGLTRVDLETLPASRASSFYLLLACLWVVWVLGRMPV